MTKIKNEHYRKFLDEGIIKTIEQEQIEEVLKNINGKHKLEAQSLVIILYFTGARPNEVLKTKANHLRKEKSYLTIKLGASKGGLPRTIYLPLKNPLIKQLYTYSKSIFPEQYLFYHYTNNYIRIRKNKNGTITKTLETTDKLRYYIKKWFEDVIDITPYYLRHNRFSKLIEQGVTDRDLMQLKGGKTIESIRPYQHMSTQSAKKIAKKIK